MSTAENTIVEPSSPTLEPAGLSPRACSVLERFTRVAVALGLSTAALASPAAPIEWAISPAIFDDGGQLHGTFTTEIVGGSLNLLDFDIVTTEGIVPNGYGITRPGFEYRFSDAMDPYPKVVATAGTLYSDRDLRALHFAYQTASAVTAFYLNMSFTYDLDSAHLDNSLYQSPVTLTWDTWECDDCGNLRRIGSLTPITVTGRKVPVTPPVPEPETYGMMLTGLGLLALVSRRRKPAFQGDLA